MGYLDSYPSYTSTRKYGVPSYGQISTPLSEQIAFAGQTSEELFTLVGKKRGFLQKGGIVDTEKTAIAVLKDFRAGKLGKISLERP